MSYEKLTEVTELAAEFKRAVEARYGNDRSLAPKVMQSLKPGELDQIQEKLQDVVNESLQYAFGGKPTESFIKKNLEIVEITADIFTRVLPTDKLAPLMPEALKSEENVKFLRDNGAPKLADIGGFKP